MRGCSLHRMIHELAERESLSAKQIAGRLGISAKTVRRHLRRERYQAPPRRIVVQKLDPFKERIKNLLERHEYTAAQIFRMLRAEGYPGGESVLRDYVSKVRPVRQKAYLTLSFEPGRTAQVDFAECGLLNVGGSKRKLYAFVMSLCYSRMIFVKFILRQSLEHFLQCHREALEFFQGCPTEIMVDNCRVAVKTPSFYGAPVLNERYADCASHYGFKVSPCGIRKPNEKGVVERNISYLKASYLNGLDLEGLSLSALNHGAKDWMDNVANVRVHGTTKKSPAEMFKTEKAVLQALPLIPYDCGVLHFTRANSQYRVVFESNKYSVPPEFAGRRVDVALYPDRLLIRHDGKLIAEHVRSYEFNRDYGLPEHDRALLEHRRKAEQGAMMRRFLGLGEIAESYYQGLQSRRLNPGVHVRKILALLDIYGSEDVVSALADAAESGAFGSDYIASILEMRKRVMPPPGTLHVSRKSDYLNLDIDAPDLDVYDIN